MKCLSLALAVVLVALLVGCESTTSSSSSEVVGSWRRAEFLAGDYADTFTIAFSCDGSMTSDTRSRTWTTGTLDFDSRCHWTGTWSVSGDHLYSTTSATCTEISGGVTSDRTKAARSDTARIAFQGNTLILYHPYEQPRDTTVLTRI